MIDVIKYITLDLIVPPTAQNSSENSGKIPVKTRRAPLLQGARRLRSASPHCGCEESPMTLEKMQPLVHLTLSARVYEDLRERIISGQVQPGERLTLAGMASALGTSAMPIREAVQKLAAEGALEILPNKSVGVPVMTRTRFQELVTIRIAVEAAASLITDAQLARLAELEKAFRTERRLATPDVNRIIQINKQFHFGAYEAAGMPTLLTLIEGLWLRIGPVLNLDIRNGSSRLANPPSVRAHRAMLDGLRAHDGLAARNGLAMDIQCAADVILSGDGLGTV